MYVGCQKKTPIPGGTLSHDPPHIWGGEMCEWENPAKPTARGRPLTPRGHTSPTVYSASEPAKAEDRKQSHLKFLVCIQCLVVLFFSHRAELPSWVVWTKSASVSAHFWTQWAPLTWLPIPIPLSYPPALLGGQVLL